ncbi:hypothetical protein IW261DRAFT_1458374 [Armillaria novae-zelandiae]|uniref:NAD(P)-binding protein n=1 Tax=Armillaria novae-zelandiae TaxID=153914 RepID=A0AA39PJA0_9AGAR|nr:hypothetical protein IW261DRAFT_1458374 [Armillaria novae-zelandiae]
MSPASKVWLITGANSGLGLAIAEYVLGKGHQVIACARDTTKLPASLKTASVLPLDLNWPDSRIKEAATTAWAIYGRVDVLVNNAGYCLTGPVETLLADDIQSQFKTNVFGPISLIQAFIPLMREVHSGWILNFSSIAGFDGYPPFDAYNASKAALDGFTDSLAQEVSKFGITVRSVAPGYFPTNLLTNAFSTSSPALSTMYPEYDVLTKVYHEKYVQDGQVGDPEKLSVRLFEIVTGEVKLDQSWTRIPLGSDCGTRMLKKLGQLRENVEGTETIWNSTDMDLKKVKEQFM